MGEVHIDNLHTEAVRFLEKLQPETTAVVVALYGELGAGKTTFTQALARALGVKERITSPTFVIEKVYPLTNQKFAHLVHIDAYRLEHSEELIKLGWEELISHPENIIVVEWADKVEDILPENAHKITLSVINEDTRNIAYAS